MKKNVIILMVLLGVGLFATSCHDRLDELPENQVLSSDFDASDPDNVTLPLIGAYAEFYTRGWEGIPLISVRGDDVNAGGLGDQQDFAEADRYNYNKDYWMFNSLWQVFYRDIYTFETTIETLELFRGVVDNEAIVDQYIAETRVMQSFLYFQLSRVWGGLMIAPSSDPSDLLVEPLTPQDEVMQLISDRMDEAIPILPAVHPADRTDVKGGVTRYTALALKALANLELENYQAVADATSEIINSGTFQLFPDFYQLFKIPGKLCEENILELQYSDFGTPTGIQRNYLMNFFAPQGWSPKVEGAGSGWGFYEPSLKWIKFMLDRGEENRLVTSVLFTQRGMNEITSDPNYSDLPDFISHITPSGDTINDYARALFASGKHYLPSEQLTPGRTRYGSNKNFICIRYAEILLMYAEALVQGASGSAGLSADDAVNLVRERSGMQPISGVTLDDVIDEKFAELGMEWGTRYYDMLRYERYDELSYDGRTFTPDAAFLPYPQNQVDQIPALQVE